MSAIENFILRVKSSIKSKSKEIRFSIQEAELLSVELTEKAELVNTLQAQIIKLQSEQIVGLSQTFEHKATTTSNVDDMDIKVDGGNFKID